MRRDYHNQVLQIYGDFWTRVWQDPNFINAMADAYSLVFEQADIMEASLEQYLSRLEIPLTTERRWFPIVLSEKELELDVPRYGSGSAYGSASAYGTASYPLSYTLPWPADVQAPFLANSPAGASLMLTKDVDYTISGSTIAFKSDPFNMNFRNYIMTDVDDNNYMYIIIWAHCAQQDIEGVKTFYGQYVNLNQASTEAFKNLVNIVWDLKVQGATDYNIKKFFGVLTDTDIVDADGKVVTVWTEAGRRMVGVSTLNTNVIDKIYSAPAAAHESVVAEEVVTAGQNIFDTFTTYRGYDVLPSATVPNLYMSRGMMGGAYSAGLSFPNAALPVTFEYWPTDASLTILSEAGDQILYRDNDTQQIALVTANTDAMTAAGIVNIPIFYIGGEVNDVVKFKYAMAYNAWLHNVDLFAEVTKDQAGPTYTINPCRFIQADVLRTNMMFVNIDMDLFDTGINPQAALRYLSNTVPAGTTFLIFMSTECNLDTYRTTDAVETLEVSHTFMLNDQYSGATDKLGASTRTG